MQHRLFVYGTLLRGEVNHERLAGARFLGPHRTQPCFSMWHLGAYPGVTRGGAQAIGGELFALDSAALRDLDRLEDFPRLYDRRLIASPWGRAWIYLYRGSVAGRARIASGRWRDCSRDASPIQTAALRQRRDPKTPGAWRERNKPAARQP